MKEHYEIIHGFKAMQTGLGEMMMEEKSAAEIKDFVEFQKKCGAFAYETIKADFQKNQDVQRFITNVSVNIAWCIKACFADRELGKMLTPDQRRELTIECFIREGHDLRRVRSEMRKIVTNRKYRTLFSGEIINEFEEKT